MNFKEALENTLRWEGVWSNRKGDPGGETCYGISRRYHRYWSGWNEVELHKMMVIGSDRWRHRLIERLKADEKLQGLVEDFYLVEFWDKYRCARLPEPLRGIYFDMCVLHGPKEATQILQTAANHRIMQYSMGANLLVIDGILGPLTIAATDGLQHERVQAFRVQVLALRSLGIPISQYVLDILENDQPYWFGWYRRAKRV